MEITHFYSLLTVSVIGHHVGSGSVCSFAFIQWFRASRCFRNKHPAVLLQHRSRPGSKNTCTHSQDAKDPLKADYLFLRQNNSSPSCFVFCFFLMHILTCTCSSSCGQNTSRADTYSLDCLLRNLFLYEIRAKNFWKSWYRNEDGLISVLVVRLWVWTQAGEIFICLLEAVVSSALLIKPGLIVCLAVKEGSLFLKKKEQQDEMRQGRCVRLLIEGKSRARWCVLFKMKRCSLTNELTQASSLK